MATEKVSASKECDVSRDTALADSQMREEVVESCDDHAGHRPKMQSGTSRSPIVGMSFSSILPGTRVLMLFRYSAIAHVSAGKQWLAKAQNAASKVLTDAAYAAEDFEEVIVAADD